jgi:hypothetical protein
MEATSSVIGTGGWRPSFAELPTKTEPLVETEQPAKRNGRVRKLSRNVREVLEVQLRVVPYRASPGSQKASDSPLGQPQL